MFYGGIVLVFFLGFWAGDWTSWRLCLSIPISIIACILIILTTSSMDEIEEAEIEEEKNEKTDKQ